MNLISAQDMREEVVRLNKKKMEENNHHDLIELKMDSINYILYKDLYKYFREIANEEFKQYPWLLYGNHPYNCMDWEKLIHHFLNHQIGGYSVAYLCGERYFRLHNTKELPSKKQFIAFIKRERT